MFCRKCGKEIDDGVGYCRYCGEKTSAEIEKAEPKRVLSVKKRLVIGGSMVLVAVLCLAMCFCVLPKIQFEQCKKDAQEEVDKAFENGDYVKAIESLKELLVYTPEVTDNYIKLAASYVEIGDLYQAKSILQTGYLNTQDESLLNVLITGPLACYERIMLIAGDVLGPSISIRCEYIFMDGKVTAKLYGCDGMTSVTLEYYFSEKGERVSGCLVEGYASPFGINTEVDQYLYSEGEALLDYYYNEDGELAAITGKEGNDIAWLVNIHYVDGKCIHVDSQEGSYKIEYDDKGRMTGMEHSWENSSDGYIYFEYNKDGSYEEKQVYEDGMMTTIKYDKNGLMQSICYQDVEGEETGTNISYENKKVVCMESTCNSYWGKLEYEYEPDGKIIDVLMYSPIQGESEQPVAEKHYNYNNDNQVIDVSVEYEKNVTENLLGYFECGSWHIDYNENGKISCATGTGDVNKDCQIMASYYENGDLKKIAEIGAEYRIETNYQYDEYGRRVSEGSEHIATESVFEEDKDDKEDKDVSVGWAVSPHEITGEAIPRLFMITDVHSDRRAVFIYMVLEEVSSGEINVVSLPCETILYKSEDEAKRAFVLSSPNELLFVLNQNYDMYLTDFVSIPMDDLIWESIKQSGGVLDLGVVYTDEEQETINNYIAMRQNKEQSAWQKVLDKQVLEMEDIQCLCEIFRKQGIPPELRKKWGEAFFYMFVDLPASSDTYKLMLSSYSEEDFANFWGRSYEDASVSTIFAAPGIYGSLGSGYFPEDASLFAQQVHALWAGDMGYIPSDTVNDIAERMKKIYLEKKR